MSRSLTLFVTLGALWRSAASSVTAVAGEKSTCLVLPDGGVKCFGDGASGQLGYVDNNDRGKQSSTMGDNLPVVDLGSGVVATSLAAGATARHNCIVTTAGGVICWGRNNNGQLGYEDNNDRGQNAATMGNDLPLVDLGTGVTVQSVARGTSRTYAITTSGKLKCWGWESAWCYGDSDYRGNSNGGMGNALPDVDFGTGAVVISVGAGDDHACALLSSGQVKCWGSGDYLGYEDTDDRGKNSDDWGSSYPAVDLGSGRTAVKIAVGNWHTCAVTDIGTVKCWGIDDNGCLGVSGGDRGQDTGEMGDDLPAVDLGTLGDITDICAGEKYTCVLDDTGGVKCWGRGSNGRLGYGDTTHRGSSLLGSSLPYVDVGSAVQSIACGYKHVCVVLTDGVSMKCWGEADSGRIGTGTTDRGDHPGEMGASLPVIDLGTMPAVASTTTSTSESSSTPSTHSSSSTTSTSTSVSSASSGSTQSSLSTATSASSSTSTSTSASSGTSATSASSSTTTSTSASSGTSQSSRSTATSASSSTSTSTSASSGTSQSSRSTATSASSSTTTSTSASSGTSQSSHSTATSASSSTSTSTSASSGTSQSSRSTATSVSSSTSTSSGTSQSSRSTVTSASSSTSTSTSASSATSQSSPLTATSASSSTSTSTSASSGTSQSSRSTATSASSSTTTSTSQSSRSTATSTSSSSASSISTESSTTSTSTSSSSAVSTGSTGSSTTSTSTSRSSASTGTSTTGSSSSTLTSVSSSSTVTSTSSASTTSSATSTSTSGSSALSLTSTTSSSTSQSSVTSTTVGSSSSSSSTSTSVGSSTSSTSTSQTASTVSSSSSTSRSSSSSRSTVSSSSATSTSVGSSSSTTSQSSATSSTTTTTRTTRTTHSTASGQTAATSSTSTSSSDTSVTSSSTSKSSGTSTSSSSSSLSSGTATTSTSTTLTSVLSATSSTSSSTSETSLATSSTITSSSSSASTATSSSTSTTVTSSSTTHSSASTITTSSTTDSTASTSSTGSTASSSSTSTGTTPSTGGSASSSSTSPSSASSSSTLTSKSSSSTTSSESSSSSSTLTSTASTATSTSSSPTSALSLTSTTSSSTSASSATSTSSGSSTSSTSTSQSSSTKSSSSTSSSTSDSSASTSSTTTSSSSSDSSISSSSTHTSKSSSSSTTSASSSSTSPSTSTTSTVTSTTSSASSAFTVTSTTSSSTSLSSSTSTSAGSSTSTSSTTDSTFTSTSTESSSTSSGTSSSSTSSTTTSESSDSTTTSTSSSLTATTTAVRVVLPADELVQAAEVAETAAIASLLEGNASSISVELPFAVSTAFALDLNATEEEGISIQAPDSSIEVSFPAEAFQGVGDGSSVPVAATVTVFNTTDQFEQEADGEGEVQLHAMPVSIKLYDSDGNEVSISGLTTPIRVVLAASDTSLSDEALSCAYWNEETGEWLTDGLQRTLSDDGTDVIVCETSHLTIFAAIVRSTIATFQCANVMVFQQSSLERFLSMEWLSTIGGVLLAALVVVEVFAMVHAGQAQPPLGWSDHDLLTDHIVAKRANDASRKVSGRLDSQLERLGIPATADIRRTITKFIHHEDALQRIKHDLGCRLVAYEEGIHVIDLSQLAAMQKVHAKRSSVASLSEEPDHFSPYGSDRQEPEAAMVSKRSAASLDSTDRKSSGRDVGNLQASVSGGDFAGQDSMPITQGSVPLQSEGAIQRQESKYHSASYSHAMTSHKERHKSKEAGMARQTSIQSQQSTISTNMMQRRGSKGSLGSLGSSLMSREGSARRRSLDPETIRETSFRARTSTRATDSTTTPEASAEAVGRILLSMPVEDHADVAIRKFVGASRLKQVQILFWSSCMWLSLQSFSFSRTPTSRCLLQILRLNGSFAIAALFLESAFSVASIDSDPDCIVNTIWERLGRSIAICLMSMLVGGVPCLAMGLIGNKSFVYDDEWDDAKRRRMLHFWWTKVAFVWVMAVPYNAFCIIYLAAFLSTVGDTGNVDWSISALFYISLDILIFPLFSVVPLLFFLRSSSLAKSLEEVDDGDGLDSATSSRELSNIEEGAPGAVSRGFAQVQEAADSIGMTQVDYRTVIQRSLGAGSLRGAAEYATHEEDGKNSQHIVGRSATLTPRTGRTTMSETVDGDSESEYEEEVIGEVVPTPRPPAGVQAPDVESTSDGYSDWYITCADSDEDADEQTVQASSKSWLVTWF